MVCKGFESWANKGLLYSYTIFTIWCLVCPYCGKKIFQKDLGKGLWEWAERETQ